MKNMITTKLFRNGGSVAVRIPAGWLDADGEVTLERDEQSGQILLYQRGSRADSLLERWLLDSEISDEVFDASLIREPITDWSEVL